MSNDKRQIDIGINDSDRQQIAEGLSKLLADTYTLYLNTHNFHWNVTGPMFNTLHLMFMDQYTELWNSVDVIAERIRALDQFAIPATAAEPPATTTASVPVVVVTATGNTISQLSRLDAADISFTIALNFSFSVL